jgi:hypothetical protein
MGTEMFRVLTLAYNMDSCLIPLMRVGSRHIRILHVMLKL